MQDFITGYAASESMIRAALGVAIGESAETGRDVRTEREAWAR